MIRSRASLQVTLSAIISLLAAVIVAGVSILLIESRNHDGERDLRRKALVYAEFFASQLESSVAFNDRQTAHEVLSASSELDSDIDSVGLYRQDGSLIEKTSDAAPQPWSAAPGRAQLRVTDSTLDAMAPVISQEGPRGAVVIRLTRVQLARARHAAVVNVMTVAAIALALSLFAAWAIAGGVASRLARIARAAKVVASGDLTQPALAAGSDDEIGRLTVSFNTMVEQLRGLIEGARQTAATEKARLTQLVDERTAELATGNEQLKQSSERYRLLVETTSAIPWEFSLGQRRFSYVGPQAVALLGYPLSVWNDLDRLRELFSNNELARLEEEVGGAVKNGAAFDSDFHLTVADGSTMNLRCVGALSNDGSACVRGLLLDVTQRKKLESDLRQAQKLESVGRLAAGVAHEINTPVQFVSDSVRFVRDIMNDLIGVFAKLDIAKQSILDGQPSTLAAKAANAAIADGDVSYVFDEAPKALELAIGGLERISTIVKSMKEFSHPDQKQMAPLDLGRAITSTLTIAQSEYKYVADIATEFSDLPLVCCHGGQINQVVLNLLVNAAHAVTDVVRGTNNRGRITVRTKREGNMAVIEIADTGGGIPLQVRSKIFDPFFTTKEVGQGTGQGLAIARSVIVEKHGGSIDFQTELGKGTTFIIKLPFEARQPAVAA